MLRRLPIIAAAILAVAACSDNEPAKVLSFSPADGEQRQYQLYSEAEFHFETRRGERSERLNTMMLVDYKVAEKPDVYSIDMKPRYMEMRHPSGSFRNYEEFGSGGPNKAIREMMEAGFKVDVDKQRNKVVDFLIHKLPDRLRNDNFDPFQKMLSDEFSRPGFVSGLTIKEGEKQELELNKPLPPITVQVESFTDSTVTVSVAGDNDEAKVFGYAVLERNSGWTKRMTVVANMPMPEGAGVSGGSIRMVTSVFPEDWGFGQDLGFLSRAQSIPMNNTDFSEQETDTMAADDEVFANSDGELTISKRRVSLSYSHPDIDVKDLGLIKITDLKPKDKDGQPLDLDLHYSTAVTYMSYKGDNVSTGLELHPLGWDNVVDKMQQLGSIEATLQQYKATHEVVEFPIDKEGSKLEMKGATATLVPTAEKRIFDLKLTSTDNAYFNTEVSGISHGELTYDQAKGAPRWVKKGESRAIAMAKEGGLPITLKLFFKDGVPDSIQLKLTHFTDQKLSEKRVTFYDDKD